MPLLLLQRKPKAFHYDLRKTGIGKLARDMDKRTENTRGSSSVSYPVKINVMKSVYFSYEIFFKATKNSSQGALELRNVGPMFLVSVT